MTYSVEEEKIKSKKHKKIATIVLICAAIAFTAWTIVTVIQNLNKNEKIIFHALVEATQDMKYPQSAELISCSKFKTEKTEDGKEFTYCFAEVNIKKDDGRNSSDIYLLITGGSGKGKMLDRNSAELKTYGVAPSDFSTEDKIEKVNYDKFNKTIIKYWNFKRK